MMDGLITTKRTILYPSTRGKSGGRGVMDGVKMSKSEIMVREYKWVDRWWWGGEVSLCEL